MNQAEISDTPTLQEDAPHPKKSRAIRWILYGVIALLVAAGGIGAYVWYRSTVTQSQKPTIKVGVLMAFTGGSSSMGYGTMKGIQLAKKQLGADRIELIQADSQCDPDRAREAGKKLIDQGVVAIIGDGCSSASVAVLPFANNSKTVMISPSASTSTLSIPNDYFFRVIPSDNYQSEFMAQTIRDKGVQNVAVFYTNEPYGTNMNSVFREKFETLGGKVVATAYAEPDVIDLHEQMKKLKDTDPQAVFIAPNSVVTATAAIRIAREVGIEAPLFGADIMYDRTITSNAPLTSEGLTVTTFSTGSSVFKQMLFNEYKVVEQLYAAPQAYDAFEAIYRAVMKGATTGEAIKDILPSIEFDGMSAHITFDHNGELPGKTYKYDLLQVQKGAFVEVQ
jgi:branched-chain amino acid transport system substrate-binding protein